MGNQVIINRFLAPSDAADIGIIGGADGPTVMLIASELGEWLIPLLLGVVIAVVIAVIVRRKTKKKERK